MSSHNKKRSFRWFRVLGAITIALSLIVSITVTWYLVAIELPATTSLESEILAQSDAVQTLFNVVSPTSSKSITHHP